MHVSRNIRDAMVRELRVSGCVFAEDEAEWLIVWSDTMEELEDRVAQRVAGMPLEYVLGWADFYGLRVVLEPGVFVPRRRTEFLVQEAVAITQDGDRVVDLCCGSGVVGLALVTQRKRCQLYAVDLDPVALRCARRNIGSQGRVYGGDLYDPLPGHLKGRVNVLVANAPYVPTGSLAMMPQEARLHEPASALDGGGDGLDIQRRIAADALKWLAPGGYLLIETSRAQAARSAEICASRGLTAQIAASDDLDATVIVAKNTAAVRAEIPRLRG